jgi:hypothetical protein
VPFEAARARLWLAKPAEPAAPLAALEVARGTFVGHARRHATRGGGRPPAVRSERRRGLAGLDFADCASVVIRRSMCVRYGSYHSCDSPGIPSVVLFELWAHVAAE